METRKRDVPAGNLILERTRFSEKLMVWAGVSKNGKTEILFIEPKTKVNKEFYVSLLHKVKPQFDRLYPDKSYVFQQDGATSHTAKYTIGWMEKNLKEFWKPNEWPPNSPDLNPLDYYVWNALQELVYQTEIKSIDHLKRRIKWAWSKLDQQKINDKINEFEMRLKLVVQADGGHIETKLL